MNRDWRVELFRCLCMIGVCLLHALDQGGYAGPHRGLDNLCTPSVVGFLFITGWYGIRLKAKHVIKLWGIGLYCAACVAILYNSMFKGEELGRVSMGIWVYFMNGWFLWCYFALMLVAPILEPLFETTDRKELLWRICPLMILTFGWSYAATKVPILKIYTPKVGGFGGFCVLTFIGIYVAARTCRIFALDVRMKTSWLLVLSVVSGAMCWIGFMHYHSPFALVFAGSLFLLFKRLPLGEGRLGQLAIWLGPSMFSVYLLHNNSMGMAWLHHVEDALIGSAGQNYYLVCGMVAIVFFAGGVVLDFPRRIFLVLQERWKLKWRHVENG